MSQLNSERIDAMADILYALISDLAMAGALPEWKQKILRAQVDAIRETKGDEDAGPKEDG